MKMILSIAITIAIAIAVGLLLTADRAKRLHAEVYAQPSKSAVVRTYGKLPLSFEANTGQADNSVKFLSRGRGYGLFLTGNEAVLALLSSSSSLPIKSSSQTQKRARSSWDSSQM